MAKRLSEKEKIKIVESFAQGESIDELAKTFNCTKLTISRNLKKTLGEKNFKDLISNNTLKETFHEKNNLFENETNNQKELNNEKSITHVINQSNVVQDFASAESFLEITPLNLDIDDNLQKDFSSIPIAEINLPKIVYMVVDKKIELEIKSLKDYPDWHFLSKDELKRNTIEIYNDLKIAKRFCNKEQKVIKVPNSEIFKLVAPILISRGISRIVNDDQLIAL